MAYTGLRLRLALPIRSGTPLYQRGGEPPPRWPDNIENTRWCDLLRPYTAMKNLYLSKAFAPRIAPALDHLFRESVTEVLPKLKNIFLEDLPPSDPAKVHHREYSHPIAVAHSDRELYKWEEDEWY